MLLDERPKGPRGECQAAKIGFGGDCRCARHIPQQPNFAEVVTRNKLPGLRAAHLDKGLALDNDKEGDDARSSFSLARERRSSVIVLRPEQAGELVERVAREFGKKRNPRERLGDTVSHGFGS